MWIFFVVSADITMRKFLMKHLFLLLAVFACFSLSAQSPADDHIITGKFNPAKEPGFVSAASLGIAVKNGPHYLQRPAAEALSRMMKDFSHEHPKVPFWVQSSTRNFASQKSIWNAKWKGERGSNGVNASNEKDPVKRARLILEYSSMPGTSRHHWGSDADFNILTNDYYEHGDGKILFDWLTKNASRYGFARPYTALRSKGYKEERWHWSYTPLSKKYLKEWTDNYNADPRFFIGKEGFEGADSAAHLALEYVEAISPECK
jgi:zinc D-Ala-D-Ala carboxypeptidase